MTDRSQLYMGDDTTATDVLDYAADRLEQPTGVGDATVFNFHNQPLSMPELSQWAEDVESGVYVVPYQISGVWAFMVEALPSAVAQARLLAFRVNDREYVDYANWRADWLQPDRGLDGEIVAPLGRIHETRADLEDQGLIDTESDSIVEDDDFVVREATSDDGLDERFEYIVEDDSRESVVAFTDRTDAVVYARIADANPRGDVDVSR